MTSLTLDAGFRHTPLLNTVANFLDSIYIPRGATEKLRLEAIKKIGDR